MKRRILSLGLALCLSLSGCASILERSYTSSTAHADRPTTAEDPSILRVENYRELVSAVLYLVSEGAEEGVIQLHDYAGSVENDLTAACLEVATQDPLGAYCVDYIKHEYTRVVSYYQATLDIHYRRTQEQVRSMVRVTGTGAIRTELRQALAQFAPEVVLRVAYFSEDADFIRDLIHQTYYEDPAFALGYPEAEISLYPDSGRERVVEILLTYPESAEELRRKSETLAVRVKAIAQDLQALDERTVAVDAIPNAVYDSEGTTPYEVIVEGAADGEGMALAYALLCQAGGLTCKVVEGTLDGEKRFWNAVTFSDGFTAYVDLMGYSHALADSRIMAERGYRWPGAPVDEPQEEEDQPGGEEKEGETPAETGGNAIISLYNRENL